MLKVIGSPRSLVLLAFALTAFGIVIASRMRRMESFQMVMGLVVHPMLFLSGAIFPLNKLPGWLAIPCRLNPATYGVDLARRSLLGERRRVDHRTPCGADLGRHRDRVDHGQRAHAIATRFFGQVE